MAISIAFDVGTGAGGGRRAPVYANSKKPLHLVTGTIAFDNSYPTGGESLASVVAKFATLHGIVIQARNGYTFDYDYSANKVKVFKDSQRLTAAVDPGSLATDVIGNTAVAVTGVATTDDIIAIPPVDLEAGLVAQSAWASNANEVTVRIQNVSAGTVDGASKTWAFIVRPKSGVGVEVADTADLSALTGVRFLAFGIPGASATS